MKPFENPTVLVTRPAESAEQFVAGLEACAGQFRPLISPAFELEQVAFAPCLFDAAIFTSKAGARFAPEGEGRIAWCVGDGTAEVAAKRGYEPKVGVGSARELATLILRENPAGRHVHFRGENVRVNVMTILENAGMSCMEVVAYRKLINAPMSELSEVSMRVGSLLLPLFSAETVSILKEWPTSFEGSWVVAISKEVAEASMALKPLGVSIAERPNLHEMTQATVRLIA
ncbi:uroporphyrinogen-III synthase [Octadecabacter sp.]|nr:uroporphyrinogen-III synthase [Octadecabacter sp.]